MFGRAGNIHTQPAYVAAQFTYDAYGNVMSADHLSPHPFLSVGHKGLFVERLDVGVADASVQSSRVGETPRLVPFGHVIYHNRNRTYNPQQGRFLQLDPNASGMAVMAFPSYHGGVGHQLLLPVSLGERLRDGANLYQYLGSSPWLRRDPTGLFLDSLFPSTTPGARPVPATNRGPLPVYPGEGFAYLNGASFMGNAGRLAGAFFMSQSSTFGDKLLSEDQAWRDIREDALVSMGGDAFGIFVGGGVGIAGDNGSGLFKLWYDGELGHNADTWAAASSFASDIFFAAAEYRAERTLERTVSKTVGMWFTGTAILAGFYGGMLEYTADRAFDW